MKRPRARTDLLFHPQIESKGLSMVHVTDSPGAAHFSLSPLEALLLRGMTGNRTAEELALMARGKGYFCTTEYVLQLVDRCDRLGLLTHAGGGSALAGVGQQQRRDRLRNFLRRILFIRIPLVDPWPLLGWPARIWGLVCRRAMMWPFVLLLVSALYFILLDFPRVAATGMKFLAPAGLPWLLLALLVVKFFHEIAHAAAARRYGCQVREMGICLLIFLPCLYVDTTSAWSLRRRGQRLEVAGAGILMELFIGAVAAHLWYRTAPGALNSIAFFLMGVSWISSLVFNANPLMRFDGYYILSDLTALPNLALRASRRLKSLFWYGLLGVKAAAGNDEPNGQHWFIGFYGVASLLYRLFLGLIIAQALSARFFPALGFGLAMVVLWQFLIAPLWRELGLLRRWRREIHLQTRAVVVLSMAVVFGFVFFFCPLTRYSVHPCRLEAAGEQLLVAPVTGQIAECLATKGDQVEAGQTLLRFYRPEIEQAAKAAALKLAMVKLQHDQAEARDKGDAALFLPLIKQAEDQLQWARADLERLVLKAPCSGLLLWWQDKLGPGARLKRGDAVGRIGLQGDLRACALLAERELPGIAAGKKARLWVDYGGGKKVSAVITAIEHDSRHSLTDSPLADRQGGPVPTGMARNGEVVPLQPHYAVRADLVGGHPCLPVGLTGKLLIPGAGKSLAGRLWSMFRRRLFAEGLL